MRLTQRAIGCLRVIELRSNFLGAMFRTALFIISDLQEYAKLSGGAVDQSRVLAHCLKQFTGAKNKSGEHPLPAPFELPALVSTFHQAMTGDKFSFGNAPFSSSCSALLKNTPAKEVLSKLSRSVYSYRAAVRKVQAAGIDCAI